MIFYLKPIFVGAVSFSSLTIVQIAHQQQPLVKDKDEDLVHEILINCNKLIRGK